MANKNYTEKTISVSRNGKKKQVVRHTIINGVKNRRGGSYIFSETKHLSNE